MLREWCDDPEEAKWLARQLADHGGFPVIVFNFDKGEQIGKFEPQADKR